MSGSPLWPLLLPSRNICVALPTIDISSSFFMSRSHDLYLFKKFSLFWDPSAPNYVEQVFLVKEPYSSNWKLFMIFFFSNLHCNRVPTIWFMYFTTVFFQSFSIQEPNPLQKNPRHQFLTLTMALAAKHCGIVIRNWLVIILLVAPGWRLHRFFGFPTLLLGTVVKPIFSAWKWKFLLLRHKAYFCLRFSGKRGEENSPATIIAYHNNSWQRITKQGKCIDSIQWIKII